MDSTVHLLDSPGIVFSSPSSENDASSILRNAIKTELIKDIVHVVTEGVIKRCRPQSLMSLYGVFAYNGETDFLVQVANKQGRLKRVDLFSFL